MEIKTEVRVFRYKMTCPVCEKGEMKVEKFEITGKLQGFNHKCTECGHQEIYEKSYPHYDDEEINTEETEEIE